MNLLEYTLEFLFVILFSECPERDDQCVPSDTFRRPNVDSVKKGDRSLRSFGPIVWNEMLPNKLKECKTLTEFKNSVKTWTPDNCRCELCKTYIGGLGYTNVTD